MNKLEKILIKSLSLYMWTQTTLCIWNMELWLENSDSFWTFISLIAIFAIPFAGLYLIPEAVNGPFWLKLYCAFTLVMFLTLGTALSSGHLTALMFDNKPTGGSVFPWVVSGLTVFLGYVLIKFWRALKK